ncbi:MAG: hypothetical protein Q4G47_03375 [Lachnospiraceae bacterium]|nr:hypothetical protein [Lachnospiraceae bacterium]
MRKMNMVRSRRSLMAVLLAASLAGTAAAAAASEGIDPEELEIELIEDEEDMADASGAAGEELYLSELLDEMSEEDEKMMEFIEANYATSLLMEHKNVLFTQTVLDSAGSETGETGFIYRDYDSVYAHFNDGYMETISDDRYDGFSTDQNVPVRYVVDSEETMEEMMMNYDELFFLWGYETVSEIREEGGETVFVSGIDDTEMVGYMVESLGDKVEEGDTLERTTSFDTETKLLRESVMKFKKKSGEEREFFICSIAVDVEEKYEPDADIIAQLDSEDAHTYTLTIDPGELFEVKLESRAGKGCMFYPIMYDGYTFYTDEECTVKATDEQMAETEEDIVLYAKTEEIYDEEMEIFAADEGSAESFDEVVG